MPLIYGKDLSENETIKFVKNHYGKILIDKKQRYHVNMSLIPKGNNYVLDFGCGWGYNAIGIKNKGNKVIGIDPSKNDIEICNLVWKEETNVEFKNLPITEFPDNTFDVVFSTQVIEHVFNVGNYLSEINRVLKMNGELIISLPNVMNPRFFLGTMLKNLEKKLKQVNSEILSDSKTTLSHIRGHINAWDPLHFTNLISKFGFKLEKYIPSEGIPFPMKKPFKSYWRGWFSRLRRFRNLSYNMHFLLNKIKDVKVNYYD